MESCFTDFSERESGSEISSKSWQLLTQASVLIFSSSKLFEYLFRNVAVRARVEEPASHDCHHGVIVIAMRGPETASENEKGRLG